MIRILFAVTLTAIFFCLGCMSEAEKVQNVIIDDKKQFSRQDLIFYINPVPQSQFNAIWVRNKNVVYATAYNLKFE